MSSVVDHLPGVVWTADAEGRRTFISSNVAQVYGYTPEEICAGGADLWLGRIHPEDLDRVSAAYVALFEKGELLSLEYRIQRKDGAWIWLHDQAMHTYNEGGVRFASGVFFDITGWRQAQESLREAKLAAEAADHVKSAFMASVSHELRTPLNAIIGFSELLDAETAGPINERQRKYVRNILESGRDLLHLINQVIDLTKAEVGRLVLQVTSFSVSEAVNDMLMLTRRLASRKVQTITLEMDRGLPVIRADESKFKQVVYSILSNAIKFTPDGGQIRVGARLARPPQGGAPGWIEVSISDTGPGIPLEDQERIFDAFRQGDASPGRTDQRGTGMGLALSRKLVELHGGTIGLESELGRGTTVRIRLPLRPQRGGREAHGTPAAGVEGPASQPLVLIVEDDPQQSELMGHYLSVAGYSTARAYDGADALRVAKELRPAVITLDVGLPDQDGLDVLASLRRLDETRGIPVVIVSNRESREPVAKFGALAWLVKPVDRGVLIRVLGGVAPVPSRPGLAAPDATLRGPT